MAGYLDKESPLGVDKDLKARFLLPLMEMEAAAGFVSSSIAVDRTRGVKDEEEQDKMRTASDINDKAMAVFKTLIHEGVTERQVADQMLKIYMDLGADGFSIITEASAGDPFQMFSHIIFQCILCVTLDAFFFGDRLCRITYRLCIQRYI